MPDSERISGPNRRSGLFVRSCDADPLWLCSVLPPLWFGGDYEPVFDGRDVRIVRHDAEDRRQCEVWS